MGLTNLINLETRKERFGYSPEYPTRLNMTYLPGIGKDGRLTHEILKKPPESIEGAEKELEEIVTNELGGTPEDVQRAVKTLHSAQVAQDLYEDYVSSGKRDEFHSWLYNKGLNVPTDPDFYSASDKNPDAAAYTKPEINSHGINTDIDEALEKISYGSGFTVNPIEQAKELINKHEDYHRAQDMEKFGNNVYLIESDDEMKLYEHFHDKTSEASDETERQYYGEMTNACLMRYIGIMASYLHQIGEPVEITGDDVRKIIEKNGFPEYGGSVEEKELEQEGDLEGKIVEGNFEKGGGSDINNAETGSESGNGIDVEAAEYSKAA